MNAYTVTFLNGHTTSVRSDRVYANPNGAISFFNNDRTTIAVFAAGVWSHFKKDEA